MCAWVQIHGDNNCGSIVRVAAETSYALGFPVLYITRMCRSLILVIPNLKALYVNLIHCDDGEIICFNWCVTCSMHHFK